MNERPAILDVIRLKSLFRFKITKPDQILAPIMETWDVELRPDLIRKLSEGLINAAKEYCKAPTHQNHEELVRRGKGFYRQLFLPGQSGDRLQAILSESYSPLLISTDVAEIPWELLHDGQNFLGNQYAIGRQLLKSTSIPISTPWQGDQIRCLLIADPCEDLPEARQEAIQLQQWLLRQNFKVDMLLGKEASETEVLVRLTSEDYNFIHYSGHVDISEEDHAQCLRLCDHQLSSAQIERSINTNGPIVVLNGCDTASVDGMANAFLKSGAQLFVGSLFAVSDPDARHWAEVFYQGLISNLPAGEALRLARQPMESKLREGVSGLAFVMYGNPCLQLVWGQAASDPAVTVLDRVLETIGLRRQDFDNTCLNILESSFSYAGDAGVSSAHLFTAMLEGPDNRLRDYLQVRDVDPVEMKKTFEQSFHFVEFLIQSVPMDKLPEISLSESVSHILLHACDLARQAKRSQVTFDDLLLAFSQRQGSGVSRLMQTIGVDISEMVKSGSPQADSTGQPPARQHEQTVPGNAQLPEHTREQTIRMRGAQAQGSTSQERLSPSGKPVSPLPRIADRYADVSFPASVIRSQFYVLQIQILLNKRDEQQIPIKVELPDAGRQAANVEVYIHAPDFEAKESLSGKIVIPPEADSSTLKFHLAPKTTGNHKIQVDFMQNNRYIGSVSLEVIAVDGRLNVEGERAKPVGYPVIDQVGVPPDLTILITHQALTTGSHQLKFVLHSSIPELKLYYREAGISLLLDAPAEWIDYNVQQVLQTARRQDVVERRLRRIGNTLWDQLIPDTFKTIYWQIKDKVHSILIVSDEPWIPWEMVRPYRKTDTNIEEGDFFCQEYALARWIRGNPPTSRITIGESRVVGVGGDEESEKAFLPNVKSEIASVQSILNRAGVHTVSLSPRRTELFQAFSQGGFHHLHIASHGRSVPQGGDLAYIALDDGNIAAIDLSGPALTFGHEHPLIFMNACETGQWSPSLTHLGGWVERFAEAGCGAFIGTLWAVEDNAAQEFARVFYQEICRGASLGDACSRARSSIRSETNASWLAYSLYSDPQATLILPNATGEGDQGKPTPEPAPARDIYRPEIDRYDPELAQALAESAKRASSLGVDFVDSLLFFETLSAIPNGAVEQSFKRLGMDAGKITVLLRQENDNIHSPRQAARPADKVGLSKSVVEILKAAERLAEQAGHKLQDVDVLEAFILHNHNGVTRMLMDAEVRPQLLLYQAFQASGELDMQRFSEAARAILGEALQLSHTSHLIGSPQILAALAASKSGLARQTLPVSGGSLDAYVQSKLNANAIHSKRVIPQIISLETCSTRAICILNLAELLARFDGVSLVEERQLIEAYVTTE
jgi:CHAT domain-containing protein